MGDWKNEEDIKAELRLLTGELKQLREELRSMVSPPKQNPSRAFLHRQSWTPLAPKHEEIDKAADAPPRRRGRRKPRKSP